jgi:hypothetical protein
VIISLNRHGCCPATKLSFLLSLKIPCSKIPRSSAGAAHTSSMRVVSNNSSEQYQAVVTETLVGWSNIFFLPHLASPVFPKRDARLGLPPLVAVLRSLDAFISIPLHPSHPRVAERGPRLSRNPLARYSRPGQELSRLIRPVGCAQLVQ